MFVFSVCFFCFAIFLVFFCAFSFLFQGFLRVWQRGKSLFFSGFLALLPKKKGLEGQGNNFEYDGIATLRFAFSIYWGAAVSASGKSTEWEHAVALLEDRGGWGLKQHDLNVAWTTMRIWMGQHTIPFKPSFPCSFQKTLVPFSGKKKEPKPKLLGPDILWWGGPFSTWRGWRDIPGFRRDIPEAPDKSEKKSLCSIFVPYFCKSKQFFLDCLKMSEISWKRSHANCLQLPEIRSPKLPEKGPTRYTKRLVRVRTPKMSLPLSCVSLLCLRYTLSLSISFPGVCHWKHQGKPHKNTKDFLTVRTHKSPAKIRKSTQKHQGNSQEEKDQGNRTTKEKKDRVLLNIITRVKLLPRDRTFS